MACAHAHDRNLWQATKSPKAPYTTDLENVLVVLARMHGGSVQHTHDAAGAQHDAAAMQQMPAAVATGAAAADGVPQ